MKQMNIKKIGQNKKLLLKTSDDEEGDILRKSEQATFTSNKYDQKSTHGCPCQQKAEILKMANRSSTRSNPMRETRSTRTKTKQGH